jgi:ribosome maturation factor RimP
MPAKEEIVARVAELVSALLESREVELVDLEYARPRRGRGILRLFLEREGGITLEELARINRVVSELLDVHDFIPGPYHLEVSSPGLTRQLKKPGDYQRYVGRLVRLTMRQPGGQVHRGILKGLEGEEVCLQEGDRLVRIPLREIVRARLDIDWKTKGKEGKNLS